MASELGPDYQRLTVLIRARITDGTYQLGEPIPSTRQLIAETGLSLTVVRRAVQQLEADGILQGHPGKAVYVLALPADADTRRADLQSVGRQVAELRQLVEHGDPEIRARVGHLEAALMDLYARLGWDYPAVGEPVAADRARA